ncbi:MAG: autoinducer 2-binding periplasmic protein LuxP [Pontibacterium sp.]
MTVKHPANLIYNKRTSKIYKLASLVLLFFSIQAFAQPDVNYVRMDEYLKLYPDQAPIVDAFTQQVRLKAIPLSQKQTRPVRIAVIYPAHQASDYWRRSVISFEARLKELSINYILTPFFSRPSVDLVLQSKQLNQALAWQPDYLVFTLDALKHRRMIERVLARGKPKLILQNITTPLRQWSKHRPFFYVGFDHAKGTRLLAKHMLKKAGYSGNYLLLYFSPGYVSTMRGDTFATEAAKHKNIRQIASYYTNGNKERARNATLRTLEKHNDLKFIFASSTDIALGVIEALKESGQLGQIMVNGWGGGTAELQALNAGELDLTVMRINDDNGVAMAEAIKLDLEDQSSRVPHVYSGDIELINHGVDHKEVENLKERAFRYSRP